MSCDCGDRDPVLEMLEALAKVRGYRLVPKEEPLPTWLDNFLETLGDELDALPTLQLFERARRLEQDLKEAEERIERWLSLYKKRWFEIKNLPHYNHVPIPGELKRARDDANAAAKLARQLIFGRISDEILGLLDQPQAPPAEAHPNDAA